MSDKTHLYVLWTTDNPVTAEEMVFPYVTNSLHHDWWKQVTLIIWGASTGLVNDNEKIQKLVREASDTGVQLTACKACADNLGASELLQSLGVDVKYWGDPMTTILKNDEKLITI